VKISTVTILTFTIPSANPPHNTAIELIEHAADLHDSEVRRKSLPMQDPDERRTEFEITDGDAAHLSRLAADIREAMRLIGVVMSEPEA